MRPAPIFSQWGESRCMEATVWHGRCLMNTCTIVAALVAPALSITAAQEHEIILHRPVKPGEKVSIEKKLTYDNVQSAVVNGQSTGEIEEHLTVEMKVSKEALAVNQAGDDKEIRITLRSFACQRNGNSEPCLHGGDVVM